MKQITPVPGLPPTSTIQDPAARSFCSASAQAIEELRRRGSDPSSQAADLSKIEDSLRFLEGQVQLALGAAVGSGSTNTGENAASLMLDHTTEADPHTQYLLRSEYVIKPQISTGVVSAGKTWSKADATNTNLIITDTAPGPFALTRSRQVLQFDFVSNNYFSGNATDHPGHFAVVLRCNTDLIATRVHGQGILLGSGNLSPSLPGGGGPRWSPSTQIETWFNGTGYGNYLIPETDGYPNKLLEDGPTYRCIVTSTEDKDGEWYIRYRLYRYHPDPQTPSGGVFELERDTGDALDNNPRPDLFGTGVAIGHVFANASAPNWSFQVKNVLCYWTESQHPVTQVPTTTAPGIDKRLLVDTSNPVFPERFAIQDEPGLETTVIALPGESATQSSFLATNNPDTSGAFQFASMGMFGVDARIYTYGVGAGHPALQFGIGDNIVMGMDNTGILANRDLFVTGKVAPKLGTRQGEFSVSGNDVVLQSTNSDGAAGPIQFKVGPTTIMGMDSSGVQVNGELRADQHTVVGGSRSGSLEMGGSDVVLRSDNTSGGAGPIRFQVGPQTVMGMDSSGAQINGNLVVTGNITSGSSTSAAWVVPGGRFSSDAGSTYISSNSLPVQLRIGSTTILGMDASAVGINRSTSITGNLTVSGNITSGSSTSEAWVVPGGRFSSDAGSAYIDSNGLPVQLRVGGTTVIGVGSSAVGINRPTFITGGLATSGQMACPSIKISGAGRAIGETSGWNLTFYGTRWKTGFYNVDTFPTTVESCADEIVGIKRILAAIYDDLFDRKVIF